jgi:peptidoglycan/LPS O-acetylase OafA/YrhL
MSLASPLGARNQLGVDALFKTDEANSMKKQHLSKRAIVGLDAARATAAAYVAVHHVTAAYELNRGIGVIFRFGQEAVLIFFLLSGFVIFANERQRALHPRGYYFRRLRRIFPALLFAMLLSTLVALDNGELRKQFSLTGFLGTLAGLQDISALKPGVIVDPYMGNDPLWSLSYEVAFYLVFPAILASWMQRPRRVTHIIGASCCACYAIFVIVPNHFTLVGAYFLVWWAGAMTANAYLDGGTKPAAIGPTLLWLLALCAVAAITVIICGNHGLGYFPILQFRHFAVALAMLLIFFGPIGRWIVGRIYGGAKAFALSASISYAVYVLHYPLLVQWHRARESLIVLGAAIVLLCILSYVVERTIDRVIPAAPKD